MTTTSSPASGLLRERIWATETGYFKLSRRRWLRVTGAAGLSVIYHDLITAKPIGRELRAAFSPLSNPNQPPEPSDWSGSPGKARFRIEGLAKVTGQKIYARDFRAKDMPNWPEQERLALILRNTQPHHVFTGLQLGMLPSNAQPMLVISQTGIPGLAANIQQQDLQSLNLKLPFSTAGPDGTQQLLVPVGRAAQFYGQAVAILVFADWAAFRRAKRALQFNPQVVQYGTSAVPATLTAAPYDPVNYLTRYNDFSRVSKGKTNPIAPSTPADREALAHREQINLQLLDSDLLQVGGTYRTQVLDPMFMEPEAGLAWLDKPVGGTLQLVLGTQATNGDLSDTFTLFHHDKPGPVQPAQAALYSCFPGGGFGGRDTSTFPPLLAVTAGAVALRIGGAVRIVQDRYEQFQSGLKQLSSSITHQLAVDRKSGKFVAFKSLQTLGAGGNNNYSQFVAELAGYCGLSGYNIRHAYVDAVAQPSLGVVAGSMRGFGGPQASFAVETLVDEAAVALKRDPIELRAANVLKQGDQTITGAPLTQAMSLHEICERARTHPLWRRRDAVQRERAQHGVWYGVGFALANQAFGTGTDGVMAAVSMLPTGELHLHTNCVDMGNGSATTLAISTAGFAGRNADKVVMGDVASFNALNMVAGSGTSCNPHQASTPPCDWTSPAWTASFSMSSSACLTAFHQVHVAEQATRVLFESGLLPAAAAIWKVSGDAIRGKTRWHEGKLHAPALPPIDGRALAASAYLNNFTTAAMVHGLYQGRWVSADYRVGNAMLKQLPIDGLAVQNGASPHNWQIITRQNIAPPDPKAALYGRSLYAPSGALIAVEIDATTHEPRVVEVELIVDAGKVLQPDLLVGQAEGGIAMGIGYALLEDLPLEDGGAGDGRWNLDRYHVALSSDMPLGRMRITTLPTQETTAKGIAEAVLCPIAPAIGNAIAHATRYRFRPRSLPIRAADVRSGVLS